MHTLKTCQTNFIMCHNDPSVLSLELNKNICFSFQFMNHFQDSDEIQYSYSALKISKHFRFSILLIHQFCNQIKIKILLLHHSVPKPEF